jgi:hypothetical protein
MLIINNLMLINNLCLLKYTDALKIMLLGLMYCLQK